MRSEVSWALSLTLHELPVLGTHLGKSEASQALGLLGPMPLCSLEQQGPRGPRAHLGESESIGKLFQTTFQWQEASSEDLACCFSGLCLPWVQPWGRGCG